MNNILKENVDKTTVLVANFTGLTEEIEDEFASVVTYLQENADEVIRKTLGSTFYSEWRKNLKDILGSGRICSYSERLEKLNACIMMLRFAEFILNEKEES